MAAPQHPKTGYALPFEVRHPGSGWSAGQDLEGVLRLGPGPAGALEELARPFDLFARLARAGALGGRSIPPEASGFELVPPQAAGDRGARVVLKGCRVDPASVVVLSHLLLARGKALPLAALDVAPAGATPALRLGRDEEERSSFPARYGKLPFEFEDEQPESGAYTFTATLEAPLGKEHRAWLDGALADWIEAVRAGAYALAPHPADGFWAETDQEGVVDFDRTLEWSVFKVMADDGAVDALVNVFAALHGRGQRIASLTLS